LIDEDSTRTHGILHVGGRVVPCVGICVDTGRMYVFRQGADAVKWRGRVYVVAKERDLLAEVEL